MAKFTNEVRRVRKTRKNKKGQYSSSTKNNIHHFGTMIKNFLLQKLSESRLTQEQFEVISPAPKCSGLESFRNCYADPHVRSLLIEGIHTGEFMHYFMSSDIGLSNKAKLAAYINVLFNSFLTGKLDRWIIDKPKQSKRRIPEVPSSKPETKRFEVTLEDSSEQFNQPYSLFPEEILESTSVGISLDLYLPRDSTQQDAFQLSKDMPFNL